MKKRKKKSKKGKEPKVTKFTKRHGWEIVRLPNGSFQWVIKRGV